jgi:mRNA interferase MazF
MAISRGDVVAAVFPAEHGKPRPALVIQGDAFAEHPSVLLLPITSELRKTPLFRIPVEPSSENGLRQPCHVMVDKPHPVSRERIGKRIGRLDEDSLMAVNRSLAVFLGFA